MFKSINYKDNVFHKKTYTTSYTFNVSDSDFNCDIVIMVSTESGTEANSIATAALLQEYKARGLDLVNNLSTWYISQLHNYKERIFDIIEKDRKYIEKYCPSLKYSKQTYNDIVISLEKKIKDIKNMEKND